MSITWRNSWVSCFESPISVFDKICYANNITQKEFHQLFKGEYNKEYSIPLINQLDYSKIQDTIGDQEILIKFKTSIYKLSHQFHSGLEFPNLYFCKKLYYCRICALHGYHSILFQSKFIDECPFHNVPLQNVCSNCNSQLIYNYYKGERITQCCLNCYEPILRHSKIYPNYVRFTDQQITSNIALGYLQLNEKEISRLQKIHNGIVKRDEKYGSDFLLYSVKELVRNET